MTLPRLLVSLPVASQLNGGDPRAILEMAMLAEASGVVDGVVLADHVVLGSRLDRYPWGTFPFASDVPWLEPLTILTAIAAVTEQITLTTGILVVPVRPAPLLAKTVATLDVLSEGRVVLGVGTGWQEEELAAAGVEHADRGQILTDYIGACRALWRQGPATFRSPSVSFEDLWCEPKPVRPGGPPVLFSGTLTARNLRRIVELGDGWIPIMRSTDDVVVAGIEQLRDAYRAAGRDPAGLMVRAPLPPRRDAGGDLSIGATLDGAAALAAIGVTEVSLPAPAFMKDPAEVAPFFDELARAWR